MFSVSTLHKTVNDFYSVPYMPIVIYCYCYIKPYENLFYYFTYFWCSEVPCML